MQLLRDILDCRDSVIESSGVYCIRCLIDGRIYIGSSAGPGGIRMRLHRHWRDLIQGKNVCRALQKAFNQFGEDQFEFFVLAAHLDKKLCLTVEQHYLDTWQPFGDFGFNALTCARSSLGLKHSPATRKKMKASWTKDRQAIHAKENKKKWDSKTYREKLLASRTVEFCFEKDGTIFKGKNLSAFARQHGVSQGLLSMVRSGKKKQCEGFTLPGVKLPVYSVKSPEGKVFIFEKMKRFAREHGLPQAAFNLVCRGKIRSCKGWTLPGREINREAKAPDGRIFKFHNTSRFARDNDLHPARFNDLCLGHKKEYKGWTLVGESATQYKPRTR